MSTNSPALPQSPQPAAPAEASLAAVAPAWHTLLFLFIIFGFAALSARSAGKMVARHGRISAYLSTMVWEYVLVGYIVWGAHKCNVKLREVVGGRWNSAQDFARDLGIAVIFWMIAGGVLAGLSFALGLGSPSQVEEAKKQLLPLLPNSGPELATWVVLSATAGFCEEIIFRGYLQKQFRSWTRSAAAAIALQAIVFGIAHAYQGGRRVILIAAYGVMFGMLAAWRKSLRPGMLGHALQDSVSGLATRLLK